MERYHTLFRTCSSFVRWLFVEDGPPFADSVESEETGMMTSVGRSSSCCGSERDPSAIDEVVVAVVGAVEEDAPLMELSRFALALLTLPLLLLLLPPAA